VAWTKNPNVVTIAKEIGDLMSTVLRIEGLDKLAKAQRLLRAQQLKYQERARVVGEAGAKGSSGDSGSIDEGGGGP
jgi:hypothetical protein